MVFPKRKVISQSLSKHAKSRSQEAYSFYYRLLGGIKFITKIGGILLNDKRNDSRGQREINLKRPSSKVLKFSPVKLLVIESRLDYFRAVVCAFAIGLSHVFIGATVIVAFMYTQRTGDYHAVLCTLGYNFFASEAILCLNFVNGWSALLQSRHRTISHVVLQLCAVISVFLGLATKMSHKGGPSSSAHSITGCTAVALTLLGIATGPFGILKYESLQCVHVWIGLPMYLLASACLCLGFFTPEFENWAGCTIVYILTSFVIFCTLSICMISAMKYLFKIK